MWVVENSDRNPGEFALQSLAIGAVTTLLATGDVLERVIKRGRKWGYDAYRAFTRSNIGYSRRVSRKLAAPGKGGG